MALHGVVNLLVNTAAENVPALELGASDNLTFTLLQIPVALFAIYLLATETLPTQPGGDGPSVAGPTQDDRADCQRVP